MTRERRGRGGGGGPPVGTEDFSEPGIFFSPGNWSRSGSAKNIFGEWRPVTSDSPQRPSSHWQINVYELGDPGSTPAGILRILFPNCSRAQVKVILLFLPELKSVEKMFLKNDSLTRLKYHFCIGHTLYRFVFIDRWFEKNKLINYIKKTLFTNLWLPKMLGFEPKGHLLIVSIRWCATEQLWRLCGILDL